MIDTTGFTVVRCDRYSPKEFAAMFTKGDEREPSYNCRVYMEEHSKDIYDTDDEIAVLAMSAPVGHCAPRCYDHVLSDDINYRFSGDPLEEVTANYDAMRNEAMLYVAP